MTLQIAPSILSADFGNLAQAVADVERGGADLIHIDVMDGRFVPNITIGIPIVTALRETTELPLDVHLMIIEPDRHIKTFAQAGASMMSVHIEVCPHLHRTLESIKSLGLKAGVALNPATQEKTLEPVAHLVDFVVVMSVNPGFSGQAFIPESIEKIRSVRQLLNAAGNGAPIEIDGGVQPDNAPEVVKAGAEILVAASAIYGTDDSTRATQRLRKAAASTGEAETLSNQST
jgi:ribulose-phosphate 3-epimerase